MAMCLPSKQESVVQVHGSATFLILEILMNKLDQLIEWVNVERELRHYSIEYHNGTFDVHVWSTYSDGRVRPNLDRRERDGSLDLAIERILSGAFGFSNQFEVNIIENEDDVLEPFFKIDPETHGVLN